MRVLAIDTSTELGSVAVCDGVILAEESLRVRARHGDTILPMIARVLEQSGVEKRAIDLIAVGIGPGSFTGTRIGVATAKGLAIGLDKPMVGIVSLVAVGYGAPGSLLAPAIDAYKGEVYFAVYERGERWIEHVAPAHALPADAISILRRFPGKMIGVGSGHRAYDLGVPTLAPIWDAPRASVIAALGEERFLARGPDDRASLEPMYIRGSDAQLP
jgi:tRNA threonylcarbamoyladenosine biosynthesis protein TsaB